MQPPQNGGGATGMLFRLEGPVNTTGDTCHPLGSPDRSGVQLPWAPCTSASPRPLAHTSPSCAPKAARAQGASEHPGSVPMMAAASRQGDMGTKCTGTLHTCSTSVPGGFLGHPRPTALRELLARVRFVSNCPQCSPCAKCPGTLWPMPASVPGAPPPRSGAAGDSWPAPCLCSSHPSGCRLHIEPQDTPARAILSFSHPTGAPTPLSNPG